MFVGAQMYTKRANKILDFSISIAIQILLFLGITSVSYAQPTSEFHIQLISGSDTLVIHIRSLNQTSIDLSQMAFEYNVGNGTDTTSLLNDISQDFMEPQDVPLCIILTTRYEEGDVRIPNICNTTNGNNLFYPIIESERFWSSNSSNHNTILIMNNNEQLDFCQLDIDICNRHFLSNSPISLRDANIPISIFWNRNSMTLRINSERPEVISLENLSIFERQPQNIVNTLLERGSAFRGLRLSEIITPICLRFYRNTLNHAPYGNLPEGCEGRTIAQNVTNDEDFWFEDGLLQNLLIYHDEDEILQCLNDDSENAQCTFLYPEGVESD